MGVKPGVYVREEHKLGMSETKLLQNILKLDTDKITKNCGKLLRP
jgi:hypothetical protein